MCERTLLRTFTRGCWHVRAYAVKQWLCKVNKCGRRTFCCRKSTTAMFPLDPPQNSCCVDFE
jgi:hypothetical protein